MIYLNFASPYLLPGFRHFGGVTHMKSNVVASKTQDSWVEDTEILSARFSDLCSNALSQLHDLGAVI